jgi:hypothetical protein
MSATTPVPETSAKRWTREMARVGREENNSGEASECRGPTSASLVRNGDGESRPMGQCETYPVNNPGSCAGRDRGYTNSEPAASGGWRLAARRVKNL